MYLSLWVMAANYSRGPVDAARRRPSARRPTSSFATGDQAKLTAVDVRDVEPEIAQPPETRAGPSERAGFIEAPVTGPPNRASSPTAAAIARVSVALDPREPRGVAAPAAGQLNGFSTTTPP